MPPFRKHERSGEDPRFGGGGGPPPRWRENTHAPPPHAPPPYHHHHHQQQRWYSDFRNRPLPPGNGRQGWQIYPHEAGHGIFTYGSRLSDRNLEDGNFHPFGSYNDGGRYIRNNRDNRGSFSHKNWTATSREPVAASYGTGRPVVAKANDRRSTEHTQTCQNINSRSKKNNSPPPPPPPIPPPDDSLNQSEQPQSSEKEQQDKDVSNAEKLEDTAKSEKKNCLGSRNLKPLKWSRSGRNLSCSSSSKSMVVDSVEPLSQLQPNNVMSVQSPCDVTASTSSGEIHSKKKPRLGWGEGLAKYEKKVVDSTEDGAIKNGQLVSVTVEETLQSHGVKVLDRSLRVEGLVDYASPATPSSVACSSSPGIEKELFEAANVYPDASNLSCLPSIVAQTPYEGPLFNLENFDLTFIANISSSINDYLQSDSSSIYVGVISINKLLLWKTEMLKALEMTESHIDALETELSSFKSEPICCSPHPLHEEQNSSSNFIPRPPPLHIDENTHVVCDDELAGLKAEDLDSPGSATSKNCELAVTNNFHELASFSDVNCEIQSICDLISASNKDLAKEAFDTLNKFMPAKECRFDFSVSSWQSDPLLIKENFVTRKRFLQFKELVLAIKFRTFQHFLKEGRLLPVRKLPMKKTHKKFGQAGNKKHVYIRSRISSSAGSSQTVPAEEVIDFLDGLLSNTPSKPFRHTLKMPALSLDKKETKFISNNRLVEDPHAVEKERSMINSWTSEETDTFIDKLDNFGKDFSKIASFLDHKTTADCIEFYYKNHKSDRFQKARKKPESSKKCKSKSTMYMVTSVKRWNREANAASLDILGEASAIAANLDKGESSDGLDLEREAVAADVLAGICGSLSSESFSSCTTPTSSDPTDVFQNRRGKKVISSRKRPLTPVIAESFEDESSDDSSSEADLIDWTDEQKSIFISAVSSYGRDFVMISQRVGTKSSDECRLFFNKARKILGLDLILLPRHNDVVSGDVNNRAGSDVVDSGRGMEGSGCKIEEDLHPPDITAGGQDLKPDYEEGNELDSKKSVIEEDLHPLDLTAGAQDLKPYLEEGNSLDSKNSVMGNSPIDDKPVLDFNLDSTEASDGHRGEENDEKIEEKDSSIQVCHESECQKNTALESCSEKSGNCDLTSSVRPTSLFPVPIKYQEVSDHNGLSDFRTAGDCQARALSSDLGGSYQVLRGCPVSVPIKKEIHDKCVNFIKPNVSTLDESLHSNLHTKFFLKKCNGSRNQNKSSEACVPPKEQTGNHSGSNIGKSSRNSDFKLFGQILTSSEKEPNSCGPQTNNGHRPVSFSSSPNLKPVGQWKLNLASHQSNLDHTSYLGSENIPVRNFNFWDINRNQTGLFPPLTDSAPLLTKYPAAFMPAMKFKQPTLHEVVMSGSYPSNVFPSNGMPDYHQMLRNRERQPFTIDMKKHQFLSEMQKRNGLDVISGIHQQAIGTVGMRGGVLVGGQCSGISDPVAAIKMHYARAEQFSGKIIKEDDTWRSKGHIGRR